MGKSQGIPLLAAGGNAPASPAYGSVKRRLAFSLESPLDESGGQTREIKLKSFPSEAPGRFTLLDQPKPVMRIQIVELLSQFLDVELSIHLR